MSLQQVWDTPKAVDRGIEGEQREIHAEVPCAGTCPLLQDPLQRSGLGSRDERSPWCNEEYTWSLSLVPGSKLQNKLDFMEP